jgi:hypothetical protein
MGFPQEITLGRPVAEADPKTRGAFIAKTYNHLLGAVILFTLLEVLYFTTGFALSFTKMLIGAGQFGWLAALGGFMLVGWLASKTAHTAISKPAQYLALTGYVVAESILFIPLLLVASLHAPGAIQSAAGITILGFLGLTGIVFWTRKDFSWMRGMLCFGGILALIAIVMGAIMGFQLGLWFSVAMVALAGGSILYDTSNVLHHYDEDRYVGASLELFASVALMFWYVLRIFLQSRD